MLWLDGFNGKEGKGSYRWLHRGRVKNESHFDATCTGTNWNWWAGDGDEVGADKINDDDVVK